jgi:hypothetical protein
MHVLLARQAHVGVILRRGPTEWWRVTLWDTKRDTFAGGQWFRGRLYPSKCDVSPNGQLFIYFGGKFNRRSMDSGYGDTWTAVSRPPYLTALTLWPIGTTYLGSGLFIDDRTVIVSACSLAHHPNHPPGPLRLADCSSWKPDDPRLVRPWNRGWRRVSAPGATGLRKPCGDLILGRELLECPARWRTLYTVYRADGDPTALFEAHWADWDQQGRLVATVGGRVMVGKVTSRNKLIWRQLASTHEDRPIRMEAPDWAQHW